MQNTDSPKPDKPDKVDDPAQETEPTPVTPQQDTAPAEPPPSPARVTSKKPKPSREKNVDVELVDVPEVECMSADEKPDSRDFFAVFERVDTGDSNIVTAKVSPASSQKAARTTTKVNGKTFIPHDVTVGAYVFSAKPMALIKRLKPVIPRSVTTGHRWEG